MPPPGYRKGMFIASPSQISTASRCLRRWWWEKVKGFKAPDTGATLFGGRVHAAIEHRIQHAYWRPDEDEDVLRCAKAAYEELKETVREPSSTDSVEQDWEMPAGGDYPAASRGRIDLIMWGENTVVDWKTTSSLRYLKTPEELIHDPQVLLYTDALVKRGALQLPATFVHVYTVTKGKAQAATRRTVVDERMLSIGRERIGKTMRKMMAVVGCETREQVPENVLACGDYGGCPHKERCFGNNEQETNMDLKGKLAARKAAQGINPPEASATIAVETKPAATTSVVQAPSNIFDAVEAPKQAGQILCIGALPLSLDGDWVLAELWLAQFARQAEESLKVSHWGLADYGKGKAAIVALVDAACRRGNIPARLIVDRRSSLGDAVADTLIPYYAQVFVKLG